MVMVAWIGTSVLLRPLVPEELEQANYLPLICLSV